MNSALAARQMWPLLEPIHAVVYFSADVTNAATAIGLERSSRYFALRAAPMGAVAAEVVSAVFYGFAPDRVADAIPAAWEKASPAEVLAARSAGLESALARLLEGVDTDALRRAADLAQLAAREADDVGGRPLTAANRRLIEAAASPALRLWQAATVLREHRGEGHVIALAHAQVGPVSAHVLRAAAGAAELDFLRVTRGWSEADINAAQQGLEGRGWLEPAGLLTRHGRAQQATYEEATDRLASTPWRALGTARTNELAELLRPIAGRVVEGCGDPMKVGLGSPWPVEPVEPLQTPQPPPGGGGG